MAQGPLLSSDISSPVLLLQFSTWSKGFQSPDPPGSAGLSQWVYQTFLTSAHAKILSYLWWQKQQQEENLLGLAGHGRDQAQWSRNTFPKGCSVARHHQGWKTRIRPLRCPPEPSQRGSGLQPTTEHGLTAPALPRPGVSCTGNGYSRIIWRSSSGSMPESSPLQPWLCLSRVLAAAQPSLAPRPGTAGSPGSGWFLRCCCSLVGSTRAVPARF